MNDDFFTPRDPSVVRDPGVTRYEFRGATIDAPSAWGEDSALALIPNMESSVTLRRVSIDKETSLDLFVSKRVAEMAPTVIDLQIEEMREVPFGGQRGMRLRMVWEDPVVGRVVQHLVCARFGDAAFVLAVSGGVEDVTKVRPAFEALAATFRFPGAPMGTPLR